MQLYLHIGGPKTGTTSFQAAITRKGALEGTGFWTPMTGQVPTGGHHYLIRSLIGIHDRNRAWSDPIAFLKHEAELRSGTAIISSEFCDRLATLHPHVFARLLDQLGRVFDHITIVRVWRDLSKLSSSRYQQSLCNFNQNDTFEEILRKDFENECRQLENALNGYNGVDKYLNVAFRDGDRGFDSVEAVCRAIGLALNAADETADERPILNEGRSLAQVAATKWLMDENTFAPRHIPTLYRRKLHNFIRDGVIARGGDRNRFHGATGALMADVQARNRAARDRFAQTNWACSWDDATNASYDVSVKDLSPTHLPAESARIAREIVEELKPKLPEIFATPITREDHRVTADEMQTRLIKMDTFVASAPQHIARASRRLVLHVGGHKTGTTSFQALLTPDANCLEPSDFWSPEFGQGKDGAHHHLIYRLIGATSRIDAIDAVKELRMRAAMEARTCLISSEFIHHLMIFQPCLFRKLIRTLRTIFDDISIVQVIRETCSLINSRYQQTLCKFIQNEDFGDYAHSYVETERRVLARTLNGFGMDLNITSLPYQPHLDGFDAAALVAKAVGLEQVALSKRKNVGRGALQMAMSRELMTTGAAPYKQLAHSQRFNLHKVVSNVCADDHSSPPFQGFDATLMAEAHATNATLRNRFAKAAWGTGWEDTFDISLPPQNILEEGGRTPELQAAMQAVSVELPAILATAPDIDRQPWNMTVTRQYSQLAKLNRAARAEESAT